MLVLRSLFYHHFVWQFSSFVLLCLIIGDGSSLPSSIILWFSTGSMPFLTLLHVFSFCSCAFSFLLTSFHLLPVVFIFSCSSSHHFPFIPHFCFFTEALFPYHIYWLFLLDLEFEHFQMCNLLYSEWLWHLGNWNSQPEKLLYFSTDVPLLPCPGHLRRTRPTRTPCSTAHIPQLSVHLLPENFNISVLWKSGS